MNWDTQIDVVQKLTSGLQLITKRLGVSVPNNNVTANLLFTPRYYSIFFIGILIVLYGIKWYQSAMYI